MEIIRLVFALSFLTILTHAQGPDEENLIARMLGATHVAPVFFDPGEKVLSSLEKEELRSFLNKIREKDAIQVVKVLVWADQEYPARMEKPSQRQIQLARDRAVKISAYLSEELKVSTVETHNMARRPSKLSEVLNTEEYQVKSTAEASGAAPSKEDIGFFEEMGRSTTALVLVVVRNKDDQARTNYRSSQVF